MHDAIHITTSDGFRFMCSRERIVAIEELDGYEGKKCRIFVAAWETSVGWVDLKTPYDAVVAQLAR